VKNLNLIFDLLLFPFLFLMRFVLSQIQNKHSYWERGKHHVLVIFLIFFTSMLYAQTPPVANDKNYTIVADVTFSGNVITDDAPTRDSDSDNDPLTVSGHTTLSDPKAVNSIVGPKADGSFSVEANASYIGNSVSFDYNITDGNGGADTATVTLNIIAPNADLAISKTGPASIDTGETMSYTLSVNNLSTSNADAQNVVVTDTLPSGFIYNGYSAPSGWNCVLGASLTCTVSTLPIGADENITIKGSAPVTAGDINNSASISSDTSDPDLSNNTSNVVITTVNTVSADLVMTKTASPSPTVTTASPLDYTLTVHNNGSDDASNVQITDNLDPSLYFVSISASTGWSCSQGKSIVCDYTDNGGVLKSGTTSSIVFEVTTPATSGDINNTASVTSSTYDPDLSNNTDTVTINVQTGTNTANASPLAKYLQFNLFGDMKLIGNANVNFSGTDPNQGYNDNVNMRYVGNSSTFFNNSSSTLKLPNSSYEIVWAGLFWEGHICSHNTDGTGNGSGTGCDWSDSDYSSFNLGANHLGEIKLKTPDRSSYIDIKANNLNIIKSKTTDWTYAAFADITQLIGKHEEGNYSVANIILTEGQAGGGGNYGGWSLLTIYRDPSNNLKYKNISVFKGFQYINSDGNPVDINGFLTPLSGPVTASIAFFAADGDPVVGGVGRMKVGKSNNYLPVGGDGSNPTDNLFNSTISEFGTPINTSVTKTYGVDADHIDVSDFITNSQSSTKFLFDVSTPSGGVDYYSVSMFAFATNLTSPIIDDINKSAHLVDSNGSVRPAGSGARIYPGSEILYTLKFKNTGDEIADHFELFDDFDFDNLTPALDLSNFDTTRIKLSEVNSTAWQSNPNCGYDSGAHKVWCKINQVNIGDDYTMEFSVRVRDDLRGLEDQNATNTAYANYKNATTGNYVVLVSNSHGNFGGRSNTFNAGTFIIPAGWVYRATSVDAINYNYPYDVDKNITTKIVNKEFSLKLAYLNAFGQPSAFIASKGFNMPVFLTLWSNDSIRLIQDGNEAPEFSNGNSEITAGQLNLSQAHQRDWVKMSFVDWNQLDWDSAGINCVQKSTHGGNLNGVPQCLSSASQMGKLFPANYFPRVHAVCLGEDTTQVPSGKDSACDPNAYNSSGSMGNIAPEIYNHGYGCLQCLADSNLSFSSRSTDDFAARPDKFVITSLSSSYPDLLRSGLEYNLTIHAEDGEDNDTVNYNRLKNDINISAELHFKDGSLDNSGLLHGTAQKTAHDFNITEGVSRSPLAAPTRTDVAGFTFNDVGNVIIHIKDIYWSAIDADDTPQDCNATQTTIADGTTRTIDGGAYICGKTPLLTFIPDYFKLSNVHMNNHAQKNYTYLSNDLNMSAHFDVTISAMNGEGNVTQNFRKDSGFYENPVAVNLNITDWNTSLTNRHPLGNAKIIKDIPATQLLGFGGVDANGTHTIPWNVSNAAQKIMFNYARDYNQTVNPFVVPGTDAKLSVISNYTGSASEGSAIIKGTAIADRNATFVYGRAKPNKFFYDNITTGSILTPVSLVAYCDLNLTTCQNKGLAVIANGLLSDTMSNEAMWWTVQQHNVSTKDGNVTLTATNGTVSPTNPTPISPVNGIDNSVRVTNNGTTPNIVNINFGSNTNSWLIYNKDADATPVPFYRVRFIGAGTWSTTGNKPGVENVVGDDVNTKKSKRVEW